MPYQNEAARKGDQAGSGKVGPEEGSRTVDSAWLLGRDDTVWIQHGDQRYQLRRTKENKLILTK